MLLSLFLCLFLKLPPNYLPILLELIGWGWNECISIHHDGGDVKQHKIFWAQDWTQWPAFRRSYFQMHVLIKRFVFWLKIYYDLFHGAQITNDATRPQWVKYHWLLIFSERNVFFLEIYEYAVHDICYFLTDKNALSNYYLAIAKLSEWYDARL